LKKNVLSVIRRGANDLINWPDNIAGSTSQFSLIRVSSDIFFCHHITRDVTYFFRLNRNKLIRETVTLRSPFRGIIFSGKACFMESNLARLFSHSFASWPNEQTLSKFTL